MTSLSVLKAQAINAVRKTLGRFETQHSRYRGWLKSIDGSVKVSGRPGYVYVQRRDTTGAQTEEIRMPDTNVPAINGYPVIVGRTSVYRTEDVIIGRDTETEESWLYDYVMQAHAAQHAQGGFDTLWVQGRVIIPLRVSAQSIPDLTVNIEPGVYPTLTGNTWYDGATDYNMSAHIPDSGQRWVIIGINQNTDLVQCVTGTPIPRSRTLEWSDLPEIPSDLVTLAAIIMHLGQTAIAENEIFELRAFAGWAGTLAVQEDGVEVLDTATALNFTGDGVEVSVDGTIATIYIPGVAADITPGAWLNDNAGIWDWAPDNVALLRNGELTEFPDPDDAFTAADTAGDVILIPPGIHILSAIHTITDVSVVGLGGPGVSVLQSTIVANGSLVKLQTSGTAYGFSIDWDMATSNGNVHHGLHISAGCSAYFCTTDVDLSVGTSQVFALWFAGTARQCIGSAHGNAGNSSGIVSSGVTNDVAHCEGIAETDGAGCAFGVECREHAPGKPLFSCIGHGICTGADFGHGLYFGTMGGSDVYVAHGYFSGNDYDVSGGVSDAYFYSVKYDPATLNLEAGATITHLPGDRAGTARDETITGIWTFDEEIIQEEQAGDPGAPGAGYAALYPKDDGGQSKYYFMDDGGDVYEIQGIVEDITKTVKAAGGDFTAIQDAIDWFENWIIKGDCIISCDEKVYAETLNFAGLLLTSSATLTVQGDTRVLAGLSYVDTHNGAAIASMNLAGLGNGGSGICTLATNPARDQITVTGSVANPDFNADGWGDGDWILVYADDGNIYEKEINSISPGGAGNHVIELKIALGAAATLGNDGTAICLKPDRSIEPGGAGTAITIAGAKGIVLDGFEVEPNTDASDGLDATNGAKVTLYNMLFYDASICIDVFGNGTELTFDTGAISCWDSARGVRVNNAGTATGWYAIYVDCTTAGVYCSDFGYIHCYYSVAANCGTAAFTTLIHAALNAFNCIARQTTGTAYFSQANAYMHAAGTIAGNNGNGTDYSPNPGGVAYAESAVNFGVLFSS